MVRAEVSALVSPIGAFREGEILSGLKSSKAKRRGRSRFHHTNDVAGIFFNSKRPTQKISFKANVRPNKCSRRAPNGDSKLRVCFQILRVCASHGENTSSETKSGEKQSSASKGGDDRCRGKGQSCGCAYVDNWLPPRA